MYAFDYCLYLTTVHSHAFVSTQSDDVNKQQQKSWRERRITNTTLNCENLLNIFDGNFTWGNFKRQQFDSIYLKNKCFKWAFINQTKYDRRVNKIWRTMNISQMDLFHFGECQNMNVFALPNRRRDENASKVILRENKIRNYSKTFDESLAEKI